jgi:hypothetical protein
MVYSRCAPSEVRLVSGACVNADNVNCSTFCNGGPGTLLPTSGLCQCTDVPDLDTVCDAACRASSKKLVMSGNTLLTYDPTTGQSTVVSALDTQGIFGTLNCLSESNCQVLSMEAQGNSFSGNYDATVPTTSSMRRRRLESAPEIAGIVNPMLCLQKGDSILFGLRDGSYPIYAKDSLLNTNPMFDYGLFRSLADKLQSNGSNIQAFAFSFVQNGVYVFALNTNPNALTVISVMDTVE